MDPTTMKEQLSWLMQRRVIPKDIFLTSEMQSLSQSLRVSWIRMPISTFYHYAKTDSQYIRMSPSSIKNVTENMRNKKNVKDWNNEY
ncbi:hypothetical protein AJ78_03303 [Emergomyces pasteurianus Ep9510]|uniref:Uncharacterized protein n=1 Tax=Emergomyces pasteurianus Ep9510 TaxID=1447872 RepID=A0A1J9PKD3_9EURO|nr:hypothetical protein AJ78_03303 [Emergomyces pasteurianus Ep9510]